MHNEARRNELLIGYTRALATVLMVCMDTISYFNPQLAMGKVQIPLWMPFISGSAAIIAIIIVLVLRSGIYLGWFRYLFPVIDGMLIMVGFIGNQNALPPGFFVEIGGLGTVGITCALLATSGALRLTRSAAAFTGGVAIVAFVVAS